ncbi:MAG TPA: LLM class flavin-dependent oxidoreductase [Candidatus Dormibacteraeota bacterium]|nr:LLM class flavin-dependent oxidoreductase [Candidatus Dormibacteraeota bacterium]
MRIWAFLIGQRVDARTGFDEIYRNLLADAELAEGLGYHGVLVAEHHFTNYCAIPNPLMLAAALGQRTTRIRIGTAVVVLPLHHPVRLAEDIAQADRLTGGRLEVGLGRGYAPYEFAPFGLDLASSAAVVGEALEVLERLWGGVDVSGEDGRWPFPPLTVTPRPVQRPRPPVWYACGSAGSFALALDRGLFPFIAVGVRGRAFVEEYRGRFEAECRARGVDPGSIRFGAQLLAHHGRDRDEVERAARAARLMYRMTARLAAGTQRVRAGLVDLTGTEPAADVPTEQIVSGSLIGDDDHIRRQLAWLEGLGVTDLSLNFRYGDLDTASVRRSMERVAELAGLRAGGGSAPVA